MLAGELIAQVVADLHDSGNVRWEIADLLRFLTDAMCQTVLLRPDAAAVTRSVRLQAGNSLQSIPGDGCRFLGVVRNMGSDGLSPGLPVTLVDRADLDASGYNWHVGGGATAIDHYVFDDAVPKSFYVTPVPGENVHVELNYALIPEPVQDENAELLLDRTWVEPLREYMMFRAYARNDASSADMAKSERHLSRYFLSLGEEAKSKLAFSPNTDRSEYRR